MKRLVPYNTLIFIGIISLLASCIEELDVNEAISSEGTGLLVVETTLTDKLESQKVFLSRSEARFDLETDTVYSYIYPLGVGNRDSVIVEQNAIVKVVSSRDETFNFNEEEAGIYVSSQPFGLDLNTTYNLEITTKTGDEYISDNLKITEQSEIEKIVAQRIINDEGHEGINIALSSRPIIGNPSLFRFSYQETFKIIAPNWNPKEFVLKDYDPCGSQYLATYDLTIVDKEIQNQVCYKTVPSNSIIQSNLLNAENKISDFSVRFIKRDNFIITHRYSINVRQYAQSIESYNFYETLSRFSESEEIFSQIQTGSLRANVKRVDGRDEFILGYVDAASVSEMRLFFNYEDIFPGEDKPPFPYDCEEFARHEGHISYCLIDFHFTDPCPPAVVELVNLGLVNFTGLNDEQIDPCENQFFGLYGPYTMVSRICGDCTLLGETEEPEFWTEI